MWKTIRVCEKLGKRLKIVSNLYNSNRTFLSNAYRCEEAWNKRLQSPLLENVDLEHLYVTLNQKFNQNGKAHAIDIDIFANSITESTQELDELTDLLHKLRITNETSRTLESTHHAVVRCFLNTDRTTDLLNILHDRLNYGIFPDQYALNILIDSLIKKKDYSSAARAAVLSMLQEDTENQITNIISIYACHMYLRENRGDWKEEEPVVDESKDEVKVRVKFLRNPYFDDHFDLKKPEHLVGKTLSFYGKNIGESLGRTYQLIGLTVYGKYEKARNLIKQWTTKDNNDNIKEILYKDGFQFVKNELSNIPENEITEEIKALNSELKNLENQNLVEENLDQAIESKVREIVSGESEKDISSQCQAFIDWENKRQSVLEEQLAELDRQNRLEKVAAMKKDLEDRERVLTFFENEEKIDLTIDSKRVYYKKKWFGKKKKPRAIDENYVPPEVNNTVHSTRR